MTDNYGLSIPENRPIFVDIDGTMTDKGTKGGEAIKARIRQIKAMVAGGYQIVMWSGGGTGYVKWFCAKHGISGVVMIGKPEYCVDDNPAIRPKSLRIMEPEKFFTEQLPPARLR